MAYEIVLKDNGFLGLDRKRVISNVTSHVLSSESDGKLILVTSDNDRMVINLSKYKCVEIPAVAFKTQTQNV